MHDLLNAVSANRILERILPLLPTRTYLVGGCIRDLLLGVEPHDFDLVTFGSPMGLASRIEKLLGGTAFLMDQERGVARVAMNHGEHTIDISPARGADIETDLGERDITINAMACLPADGDLIDPLRGVIDLRERRIRLIGEKNLLDDPLRGLRCLRFAVQLGYSVDERTWSLIGRHAHTIGGIAPERIKHEFLHALATPRGSEFFAMLDDVGYVGEIFGRTIAEKGGEPLSCAVLHADRVLHDAGRLLPGLGSHFSEELEHGLPRSSAFRIAAFLLSLWGGTGSCSGDIIDAAMARLALSARARKTIRGTLTGAFAVHGLAGASRCTGRTMYGVLSDHDGHIPEILLMALASGMGYREEACGSIARTCSDLWAFAQGQYRVQKTGPLLSGRDIIDETGIEPGPIVSEWLRMIEEARADGLLASRQDALSYLRRHGHP